MCQELAGWGRVVLRMLKEVESKTGAIMAILAGVLSGFWGVGSDITLLINIVIKTIAGHCPRRMAQDVLSIRLDHGQGALKGLDYLRLAFCNQ
jgi:hypothetical protein